MAEQREPQYTNRRGGGQRQGDDRRAPQGENRRAPQETRNQQSDQGQRREPDQPAEGDTTVMDRVAHASALVLVTSLQRLRQKYAEAKIDVPSETILSQFAKNILMAISRYQGILFKANLSLASVSPAQLGFAINHLATTYIKAHQQYLAVCKKKDEPVPNDEGLVGTNVTTIQIAIAENTPFKLR